MRYVFFAFLPLFFLVHAAEGAVLRCVGPTGAVVAFSNIRCPAGTTPETVAGIRETPPPPPVAAPAEAAAPGGDVEALRQEVMKPCQDQIMPAIMRKHPKAVGQVSINFSGEASRVDTAGGPQLTVKVNAQFLEDNKAMEVEMECVGLKNRIMGQWEVSFKELSSKTRPDAQVFLPEEKKDEKKEEKKEEKKDEKKDEKK